MVDIFRFLWIQLFKISITEKSGVRGSIGKVHKTFHGIERHLIFLTFFVGFLILSKGLSIRRGTIYSHCLYPPHLSFRRPWYKSGKKPEEISHDGPPPTTSKCVILAAGEDFHATLAFIVSLSNATHGGRFFNRSIVPPFFLLLLLSLHYVARNIVEDAKEQNYCCYTLLINVIFSSTRPILVEWI